MNSGSLIAVLVGLLLLIIGKVCLDLTSRQAQGWQFNLCFVMLRMARRRLPAELRVARHDEEFVPELEYILFDKYANEPIVGLFKGFRFALGHVRGAKRLAKENGVERRRGTLLNDRFLDTYILDGALRRISAGEAVIAPDLVQILVQSASRAGPLATLSTREHQVLCLMALGMSDAGIAERLVIPVDNVGIHLQGIFTKLGLPNTANSNRRVYAALTWLHNLTKK
jgi:DNA-binding CsgD family transcriptional regulator